MVSMPFATGVGLATTVLPVRAPVTVIVKLAQAPAARFAKSRVAVAE